MTRPVNENWRIHIKYQICNITCMSFIVTTKWTHRYIVMVLQTSEAGQLNGVNCNTKTKPITYLLNTQSISNSGKNKTKTKVTCLNTFNSLWQFRHLFWIKPAACWKTKSAITIYRWNHCVTDLNMWFIFKTETQLHKCYLVSKSLQFSFKVTSRYVSHIRYSQKTVISLWNESFS